MSSNLFEAIIKFHPEVVTVRDNIAYDETEKEVVYDPRVIENYLISQSYIAKRQSEYPPITEQLDIIFHQGLEAWKSEIQAIKDKYPK